MNNRRTQRMTAWLLVLILAFGMLLSDTVIPFGMGAVSAVAEESEETAAAEPVPAPASMEAEPAPKEEPAPEPTREPDPEPTAAPTEATTEAPTEAPTAEPEQTPDAQPTEEPTPAPTEEPSEEIPLLVRVSASASTVRVGQTAEFSILVEGGTPEYTLRGTATREGALVAEESLSGATFAFTPREAGVYTFSFFATDAEGQLAAAETTLTAVDGLAVELTTTQKYAFVGRVDINAREVISGGSAPYTCVERVYCDGTAVNEAVKEIAEAGAFNYTYAPVKHGEYKIVLTITDANGETAETEIHLPVAEEDPENSEGWAEKARVALTGDWHEDLVRVAATQLGYRESDIDFIIDENDVRHFYTMYGDWYGCAYEEWCAMFVSWCLERAGIDAGAFPRKANCERWKDALKAMDAYEEDTDAYTPKAGDLVFFNWENGSKPQHIGIVAEVSDSRITTIEGNSGRAVTRDTYSRSDRAIIGYGNVDTLMFRAGLLEAAEDAQTEWELTDEATGVRVIVSNDALPEGITADALTLNVQTVAVDAEDVVDAVNRIDEYIFVETVYDIKLLLTETGEEIQPVGEVRVVFPETETETVTNVYHIHGEDISRMGLEGQELRVDGFSLFLLSSSSHYGFEDSKYTHLAWKRSSDDDRAIRLWPKDGDYTTDSQVVYCYNQTKAWPDYDNGNDIQGHAVPYWATNDVSAATFKSNMTSPRSGLTAAELRSKVISAVANGYPRNASGILDKYSSLSAEVKVQVTQYAVWYFTDSVNAINPYALPSGTNMTDANALFNELITTDLQVGENQTSGINLYNTDVKSDADGYAGKAFQSLLGVTMAFTPRGEEPEVGTLYLSKAVVGDNVDADKEFTFTINAVDKDGVALNSTYDTTMNGVQGEADFVNGVFTTRLKDGDSLYILDLPVDATFTVTESDADGYVTTINGETTTNRSWTGSMEDTDKGYRANVNVENEQVGDLTIAKTVVGKPYDATEEFTFVIEAKDDNGDPLEGEFSATKTQVTAAGGTQLVAVTLTFVGGKCTTTLKAKERIIIQGLPTVMTYSVKEANASDYKVLINDVVNEEHLWTGQLEEHTSPSKVEGQEDSVYYDKTLVFTNIPLTALLHISKQVEGSMGDKNKEFTFTVNAVDENNVPLNGSYLMLKWNSAAGETVDDAEEGSVQFVNGSLTVKLKHGDEFEVRGLPLRSQYTVTETDADGYTTTINGIATETRSETLNALPKTENEVLFDFVNTMDAVVPTGVILAIWPYLLAVLAAIGAILLLVVFRRKK